MNFYLQKMCSFFNLNFIFANKLLFLYFVVFVLWGLSLDCLYVYVSFLYLNPLPAFLRDIVEFLILAALAAMQGNQANEEIL